MDTRHNFAAVNCPLGNVEENRCGVKDVIEITATYYRVYKFGNKTTRGQKENRADRPVCRNIMGIP